MRKILALFVIAASSATLLPVGSARTLDGVRMSRRTLQTLTIREHWRVKPFMGYQGMQRFGKTLQEAVSD